MIWYNRIKKKYASFKMICNILNCLFRMVFFFSVCMNYLSNLAIIKMDTKTNAMEQHKKGKQYVQ